MLTFALKEWAVICDLLLEGRMAVLVRKGGILETGGPGRFELEHPRFALYPSWAHQRPEMLKPEHRDRVRAAAEPAEVPLRGWAEVAGIWCVRDRAPLDPGGALDALHPWSPAQLDMRFSYKPQNPLYLVVVRAYRLAVPKTIANLPEYQGCRSWVPLSDGDAVEGAESRPVLDEGGLDRIIERLSGATST